MVGITSIRELVSQGLYREALYLYARLRSSSYRPNFFTFPSLLKACAKLQLSADARKLHTHVVKTGFLTQVYTGTALTDVYMKLYLLDDALKVFSEIPNRNIASLNALIAGFAQFGSFREALHVIRELQRRGLRPNSVTLASVLPACGSPQDGLMLHCFAIKMGSDMDIYVATAVVSMYSRCQEVDSALRVFVLMPYKKVVSYNALMSGLLQNGLPLMVIDLFKAMRERLVERPSSVTWLSLLSACSNLSALQFGRQIHCFLLKNELEFDVQLGSSFVDMYSKCGSPALAYKFFGTMSDKNITTWNSIISGMFLHSQGDIALTLFEQVESEGLEPDTATWNTMISGFARLGDGIEAFNFFNMMQLKGSVEPTLKTVTSILPACSALSDLKHGKEVHCYTMRRGYYDDDNFLLTAIIDMYMKCGCHYKAQIIFDRVNRESKDVPMWNAMIDGYGRNGENELALAVFDQMQKERVKPNSATFLSIISACGGSGQLDKAQEMFRMMIGEHGLNSSTEHVSCMVDLLGRAGRLGEARELSRQISSPSASVFASLLGSCKIHSDIELGEEMTRRLFELDPGSAAPYVILAAIYAQNGMWAEAERVRQIMKDKGLQKVSGCSWIVES